MPSYEYSPVMPRPFDIYDFPVYWIEADGGWYMNYFSLFDLLPVQLNSLLALGSVGFVSAAMTSSVLLFMVYRTIFWKKYYDVAPTQNQNQILLFNLMLSALLLSMAFVVSFYWYTIGSILAPHPVCTFQGYALAFGGISNQGLTLFIAIENYWYMKYRAFLRTPVFYSALALCWILPAILSIMGPLLQPHYYRQTGLWCWACEFYGTYRIVFQYAWLLVLITINAMLYIVMFIRARRQLNESREARQTISSNRRARVTRAVWFMLLYAAGNMFCMLPIIIIRTDAMVRRTYYPTIAYAVTGCILASTGTIDTIFYAFTRSTLERDFRHPSQSSGQRLTSQRNVEPPRTSIFQAALDRLSALFSRSSVPDPVPDDVNDDDRTNGRSWRFTIYRSVDFEHVVESVSQQDRPLVHNGATWSGRLSETTQTRSGTDEGWIAPVMGSGEAVITTTCYSDNKRR